MHSSRDDTNIRNIRLRDGTPCASVKDAVDRFRCPGPCSPDCGLYRPIRVNGGPEVHMCDPSVYAIYPMSVLDAMGCSYDVAVGQPVQHYPLYAAVLRSEAVRDVQTCRGPEPDPMGDDWEDCDDAEMWLGFFRDPFALEQAAAYGRTDPCNIRLIPVADAERDTPIREIILIDAGDAGLSCRNYDVRLPAGTTVGAFLEMLRQERQDDSGTVYLSMNLAEASVSNHGAAWKYRSGVIAADMPRINSQTPETMARKVRIAKACGGWGTMDWFLSLEPEGTHGKEARDA